MTVSADRDYVRRLIDERDEANEALDRLLRAGRALAGREQATLDSVTQEAIVTVLEAHKPGATGVTISSPPTDDEIARMMAVCWIPGLSCTGFFEHAAREIKMAPAELLAEVLAVVEAKS